jgi:hypothetical protein
MALPIAPTPVLRGKDANEFEKKLRKGLKNPTTLISTPKLQEARKLAIQYANRNKE